ncbi:hypothetical protein GN958_ATG05609 [Phytophthora infestans]|uniref:Uncharacterized protein n=1 Tax=Phytophthora infestans TaxID=4787 RepID=A0A8S9V424_PHYIN|nr:hypothetical protein GN958_ATG05609 [Phytophthora infestans]
MASQNPRQQAADGNESMKDDEWGTKNETVISPAEPVPRFDELPTAEQNAKTPKDASKKSPGALERAKREQYLWDQKVKAALAMTEEVKAANKLRENRGVKRSAAGMYDDESSTNSRSLSENSDGPPTKKMKSRGSMSLPIEVVEELIASYLHTHVSPELDLPTPWWSVEGEGTDAVRGVTYWNSKWNAWEIDMTEEDQSDCGSTSKTLSICGAKEDFGSERDDDRGGQRDRSGATTRDSSRTAATD